MFDQTNNDDAVSHVSIRNFKHPTNCSDFIHVVKKKKHKFSRKASLSLSLSLSLSHLSHLSLSLSLSLSHEGVRTGVC